MKKQFASILITNYNKKDYILKTLNSCLKQNFRSKEILIFDDVSTDGSCNLIKKFKGIKLIKNKKKKYKSAPLNQIHGIIELFKKSKGQLIFLLDGDDIFKKNKLRFFSNLFNKNKKINFAQDKPFSQKHKNLIDLKKKNHSFSIWPSFYPTSSIVFRRAFFIEFLRFLSKNEFPNLEIDARLAIYAFFTNNFFQVEKNFTLYTNDLTGINSKYRKYSLNWWRKRFEAFNYLKKILKQLNLKFNAGIDYYFTKLINLVIK